MDARIITLARRTDRARNVERLSALLSYVADVQVVQGVDGFESAIPGPWRGHAGAWGNVRSHEMVLSEWLAESSSTHLLVLEDDTDMDETFPVALRWLLDQTPKDWELLMLGGEHVRSPLFVRPGIVRCRLTARTHAYVVTRTGARLALEVASGAGSHWDRTLADASARRRTYAPHPFMVGVIDSPSDTGTPPLS